MRRTIHVTLLSALAALVVGVGVAVPSSGGAARAEPRAAATAGYWTSERRAQALPRDLVLDTRGLGYLRLPSGGLRPYGHDVAPMARPGGSDSTPPSVTNRDPAEGVTIGSSYTFRASVTDASGVKSVSVVITYPNGTTTQSFTASKGAGDVWSTALQGFTDGNWQWHVVAKDNARPSNTSTSAKLGFTVSTDGGGGGGGGGDVVTNAEWSGGAAQKAIGRVYFEMPTNPKKTRWAGYVCSGTAVTDSTSGVSIVLTAAHCAYDDVYKEFARNVLFIPNQAQTTGSGTDLNCSNDPLGCWAPTHGVVDADWTTRTFPDNIAWDYAYYVVPTSGAHTGSAAASDSLENAAGTLGITFAAPVVGSRTHALGYSYSEDPKLMYCAEDLATEGSANWWLGECGLSGGSSGGPWSQPFDEASGSGPVISVNSWGYTNQPGMAGPKLSGTSAQCVFLAAQTSAANAARGLVPDNC